MVRKVALIVLLVCFIGAGCGGSSSSGGGTENPDTVDTGGTDTGGTDSGGTDNGGGTDNSGTADSTGVFPGICDKMFMTFDTFNKSVQAVTPSGFTHEDAEDNCQNRYYDITLHNSSGRYLNIQLLSMYMIDSPSWSGSPYKLDGKDAEYELLAYSGYSQGVLKVYLPLIESLLVIRSDYTMDQAGLESIARNTGLMDKKVPQAQWPDLINPDFRLKGMVYDIIREENPAEGPDFKYRFTVIAMMDSELDQSFKDLQSRYVDDGNIKFPDGSLINYPTDNLYDMYKDYDWPVRFDYYIP